jgi:hypothetical protein
MASIDQLVTIFDRGLVVRSPLGCYGKTSRYELCYCLATDRKQPVLKAPRKSFEGKSNQAAGHPLDPGRDSW